MGILPNIPPTFSALRHGGITLHLISLDNMPSLLEQVAALGEPAYFDNELSQHYIPKYDGEGRRTKWGFYAERDGELSGFSLLGVSSWGDKRGYTGADTLPHKRGQALAPQSKPHLFFLGFHLLGLNRIETGCFARNTSSRRSIEKTPGFVFEGTLRQYAWDDVTERFEDELRYSILREDWERLYDAGTVEVII